MAAISLPLRSNEDATASLSKPAAPESLNMPAKKRKERKEPEPIKAFDQQTL